MLNGVLGGIALMVPLGIRMYRMDAAIGIGTPLA
jgi:hypothetical protein